MKYVGNAFLSLREYRKLTLAHVRFEHGTFAKWLKRRERERERGREGRIARRKKRNARLCGAFVFRHD